MNLSNLVSGSIGIAHLIFSIIALILGTIVLFKQKGTKNHKKLGYFYTGAMLGLNLSAFMLYRLFGTFGIFHWMAILSLLTIAGGMIPMILKKPKFYFRLHFSFMYWSVIGLYGAFVAETLVRIPDVVIESEIPNSTFYNMTGVAVGITMSLGAFFFVRNKNKWSQHGKSIK